MVRKVTNRSKINVMFFISSYGLGGYERILKNLVDNFDKNKYNITVVLCYPLYTSKNLSARMRQKYFNFLHWKDAKRYIIEIRSPFHVHIIFKLVKILKQQNTDVLFFFALGMGTFIAPISGVIARIPILIRTNANLLHGLYPRIFKPLDTILLKFVDKIVFPAEYLKNEYLKNFNINNNKVTRIYNGVDLSVFSRKYKNDHIKDELDINENYNIIGIIANLTPVKSHKILIHAFPTVLEKHPQTKLLIIGEGPQENELRQLVSQLNLTNTVIFLGYRSNTAQLISMFDIGVLCSRSEIHPVSLLEIMASGIPVIAPAVGGIPEIVKHEKTGLLFQAGKSDELSYYIIRLLTNKKEAKVLGKRGQKFVHEHFSLQDMIINYQNLFTRMYQNNE